MDIKLAQELFTEELKSMDNRGVANYRTHTIKAGKMLEVEAYPIHKPAVIRRKVSGKLTGDAQMEVNHRNAQKRVTRLINANFDEKDIGLSLTYDGQAPLYEQALRDIRNFIRRVKNLRKRLELGEMKYLYVIEFVDRDGVFVRIHHHIVLSGGIDRDTLEKLWRKGRANTRRLEPNEYGLTEIARYITKGAKQMTGMADMPRSGCKKGKHWSKSQNLVEPRETVSDHKLSRKRVERMALELEPIAKEIFEKLYTDYIFLDLEVKTSNFVTGAYIYARMRKRD